MLSVTLVGTWEGGGGEALNFYTTCKGNSCGDVETLYFYAKGNSCRDVGGGGTLYFHTKDNSCDKKIIYL